MKIRPLGFYILIEVDKVENISEGGIVLPDSLINKEQSACEFGTIVAIGPTAFAGMPGCEYDPDNKRKIWGAEAWGLKIGDRVEYRRYEGKVSSVEGEENMRYVPDTQIIGGIDV